jgi:hypothetical protein
VSTCGFGDISAMKGDFVESFVILLLQFVGMLFYSMTIQNVQAIMIERGDDFSAADYAVQMVEVVENLIVKVEKILPPERKIPIEAIKEFKEYSRNFFASSPNIFLAESKFYNQLSSSM